MYELRVFKNGAGAPFHTEGIARASDALDRIQALLAEHSGCERIEVHYAGGRLFSVDCAGNKID